MYQEIITKIEQAMLPHLNNEQLEVLHNTLEYHLHDLSAEDDKAIHEDLVALFLAAKRVEGCSDKTIHYYEWLIKTM